MSKTLEYELRAGGSSRGISWYTSNLTCARRQNLNDKLESTKLVIESETGVGTLTHAFLDMYHSKLLKRTDDPADVVFTAPDSMSLFIDEAARDKAETLFRAYRVRYLPNLFGKVLATEEPLSKRVESASGATFDLTGIADMIVKPNKRDCQNLADIWRINLTPGVYVVDFKTIGRASPVAIQAYTDSLQATAYQYMYPKARGMLFVFLVKTARPTFQIAYAPPPTDMDIYSLKSAVAHGADLHGLNMPNRAACYSWNRACPHLVSEACNRI